MPEDHESRDPSAPDSEERTKNSPSVFCNHCGWENPPKAHYCSRCGAELQDLSEAPPPGTRSVKADLPTGSSANPEEGDASADKAAQGSEPSGVGQQIVWVVGGALVLVLALFFVTQWSAQRDWEEGSNPDPSTAQGVPDGGGSSSSPGSRSLKGQSVGPKDSSSGGQEPMKLQRLLRRASDSIRGTVAGEIDSLRARVDQASANDKQQLRAELVNLLIGAGHPGEAAVVQKQIAEATGTVDAHRRVADLLYRWMQKLQRQGQQRLLPQVARHVAEAYGRVAEMNPGDLDARTRMGEAYLLTKEPMRGIQAINAVLEEDSTFVPARFQKGLALLQIRRVEQAKQQFKTAKQYAEEGSPFYRQAVRALKVIEKQQAASRDVRSGNG